MRKLVGAVLVFVAAASQGAEPGIGRLAWMSGCWSAANAEAGSGEHWTPPAGGSMFGTSRTLRQGRLVEFEFMQLRTLDDGTLVFIAQPSGGQPTTFRLKTLGDTSVTFENLAHDFPQRVSYAKVKDGNLSASIEGTVNGAMRRIEFPLLRTDCRAYFQQAAVYAPPVPPAGGAAGGGAPAAGAPGGGAAPGAGPPGGRPLPQPGVVHTVTSWM